MTDTSIITGAVYYVDAQAGSDQNDGRSTRSAWKSLARVNATVFRPGDCILFKAGCRFVGQLHPQGSGTADAPITIDSYGGGDKPRIDGGGSHGSEQDDYTAGAAVLLYNQDYWELRNLDITNCNPFFTQPFRNVNSKNEWISSPDNRYRYGVLIRWHNYGVGRHVYLEQCDIHDVNGELQRFCAEGVLVVSTGTREDGTQTCFDDVRLENNTVKNIGRTGISVWSQWAEGRGTDYPNHGGSGNFYHGTVGPWKGSTRVVLRGNRVEYTAGDAILVNGTDGALIEHNYVAHACYEMRIGCNAAVWPHNADNTVMQYNEVCYTHGVLDGQSFDIDLSCNHTLVQYNYSHDNEGGFILVMNRTSGNVIRYNISRNDQAGLFWINDNEGTSVYNNTFYLGYEHASVFRVTPEHRDLLLANNIFCFRLPGGEANWTPHARYQSNCYCNAATLPDDPGAIQADPLFVDGPDAKTGRCAPEGFRLRADSPCAGAGTPVAARKGLVDYCGKAVKKAPSIGACETE